MKGGLIEDRPLAPSSHKQIQSVEVLRITAAVLVVCFHIQTAFDVAIRQSFITPLLEGGFRGVDFFFVLSGFIILRIHQGDIDHPDRLPNYLYNRLARIYPSVWLLSLPAIALYVGIGDTFKTTKLTSSALFASIFLLPQTGIPLINVTWTLTYELFFYLIFALFIVNFRLGLTSFLLWQSATLLSTLVGTDLGLYGYYLKGLCLHFSVGMGIAWLLSSPVFRSLSLRVWWPLLLAGLALFVFGITRDPSSLWAPLPCSAGAGVIIMASVRLEEARSILVPKGLAMLGGASYAIYLVHFSAIQAAKTLLARMGVGNSSLLFPLYLLVGVGSGLLFYRYVDRPLQRHLRGFKPVVIGADRRPKPAVST